MDGDQGGGGGVMNTSTLLHSDRRTNLGSENISNSNLQLINQLKAFLEQPINDQALFARLLTRVRRMALRGRPQFKAELIPEITHEVIRHLANPESDGVCMRVAQLIARGDAPQELLERLDELIEQCLASIEATASALNSGTEEFLSHGRRRSTCSYERHAHRHQSSETANHFLN